MPILASTMAAPKTIRCQSRDLSSARVVEMSHRDPDHVVRNYDKQSGDEKTFGRLRLSSAPVANADGDDVKPLVGAWSEKQDQARSGKENACLRLSERGRA